MAGGKKKNKGKQQSQSSQQQQQQQQQQATKGTAASSSSGMSASVARTASPAPSSSSSASVSVNVIEQTGEERLLQLIQTRACRQFTAGGDLIEPVDSPRWARSWPITMLWNNMELIASSPRPIVRQRALRECFLLLELLRRYIDPSLSCVDLGLGKGSGWREAMDVAASRTPSIAANNNSNNSSSNNMVQFGHPWHQLKVPLMRMYLTTDIDEINSIFQECHPLLGVLNGVIFACFNPYDVLAKPNGALEPNRGVVIYSNAKHDSGLTLAMESLHRLQLAINTPTQWTYDIIEFYHTRVRLSFTRLLRGTFIEILHVIQTAAMLEQQVRRAQISEMAKTVANMKITAHEHVQDLHAFTELLYDGPLVNSSTNISGGGSGSSSGGGSNISSILENSIINTVPNQILTWIKALQKTHSQISKIRAWIRGRTSYMSSALVFAKSKAEKMSVSPLNVLETLTAALPPGLSHIAEEMVNTATAIAKGETVPPVKPSISNTATPSSTNNNQSASSTVTTTTHTSTSTNTNTNTTAATSTSALKSASTSTTEPSAHESHRLINNGAVFQLRRSQRQEYCYLAEITPGRPDMIHYTSHLHTLLFNFRDTKFTRRQCWAYISKLTNQKQIIMSQFHVSMRTYEISYNSDNDVAKVLRQHESSGDRNVLITRAYPAGSPVLVVQVTGSPTIDPAKIKGALQYKFGSSGKVLEIRIVALLHAPESEPSSEPRMSLIYAVVEVSKAASSGGINLPTSLHIDGIPVFVFSPKDSTAQKYPSIAPGPNVGIPNWNRIIGKMARLQVATLMRPETWAFMVPSSIHGKRQSSPKQLTNGSPTDATANHEHHSSSATAAATAATVGSVAAAGALQQLHPDVATEQIATIRMILSAVQAGNGPDMSEQAITTDMLRAEYDDLFDLYNTLTLAYPQELSRIATLMADVEQFIEVMLVSADLASDIHWYHIAPVYINAVPVVSKLDSMYITVVLEATSHVIAGSQWTMPEADFHNLIGAIKKFSAALMTWLHLLAPFPKMSNHQTVPFPSVSPSFAPSASIGSSMPVIAPAPATLASSATTTTTATTVTTADAAPAAAKNVATQA
ncbi:hypothetical protein GQ42DRAFT_18527 [Ramicandelaber brevisporus]|nr:hypothetical protein GQ42DRAFT_18527 [Ramicandelaber brevisporus]